VAGYQLWVRTDFSEKVELVFGGALRSYVFGLFAGFEESSRRFEPIDCLMLQLGDLFVEIPSLFDYPVPYGSVLYQG
jgi:hypothetical protein